MPPLPAAPQVPPRAPVPVPPAAGRVPPLLAPAQVPPLPAPARARVPVPLPRAPVCRRRRFGWRRFRLGRGLGFRCRCLGLRFRCRRLRCRRLHRGRGRGLRLRGGFGRRRLGRRGLGGIRWRGLRRLGCRCLLPGARLGLLALELLGLPTSLFLSFLTRALLGLATSLFLSFLACPFLGLLAFALEPGALLLLAEDVVPLRHHVADRPGNQGAGPDRVVVAGNHIVDPVGVAVGVDQADDGNAQALGLAHRDRLGLEVDHEYRVRQTLHVLDPAEVGPELLQVGQGGHALARGQQLELALGLVALEVVQTLDPQRDGLEVRQQAAEPAVVHERHVRRFGVLADRVPSLLLGAHEQHGAAAPGHLRGEVLRVLQERLGLEEVDDVVAVALAEDEAAHLGVPATGLVAEMDAGLQQLFDTDLSH